MLPTMATRTIRRVPGDHWLARAAFGLVLAGLATWLVALYLSGALDL
jgi:uncharacterized membrane protein YhdT